MINGADEDRAIEQYRKDLESGKIDIESHWHTRYVECKAERDDALMKALDFHTKLSRALDKIEEMKCHENCKHYGDYMATQIRGICLTCRRGCIYFPEREDKWEAK